MQVHTAQCTCRVRQGPYPEYATLTASPTFSEKCTLICIKILHCTGNSTDGTTGNSTNGSVCTIGNILTVVHCYEAAKFETTMKY